MWARGLAILAVGLTVGCGSETGIVISVTKDSSVTEAPKELQFIVGVANATDPALFVSDPFGVADPIDVAGRNLASDAYKLLLRDTGTGDGPSTITVAVLGLKDGQRVAFAGMPAPQTFMSGKVLEYELVLRNAQDGVDYDTTATGCLSWGTQQISAEADLDCDSCDDTTGGGEACTNECAQPADCETLKGAAPCGTWACNAGKCELDCPNCTDADMDGYGEGDGCAGLDCDDENRDVTKRAQRPCYTGPDGTLGKGICRAGSEVCTDGVWGQCTGEVTPSGEACNGDDDDCDDLVDEDLGVITCGTSVCTTTVPACTGGVPTDPTTCVPPIPTPGDATCDMVDDDCDGLVDEDCGCVLVAPGGNDITAADDANGTPFGTVQGAIDWAEADSSRPRIVCLSSGDVCGAAATFSGAIKMADGISVIGGWTNERVRCLDSHVVLKPGTATGVEFPSNVSATTVLEKVTIERHNTGTVAGITLSGATGVVIRNVIIANTPLVETSFGINMTGGAEALIEESSIWGGNGTQQTVGIRSKDSKPTIRNNCGGYDSRGRCNVWCGNEGPGVRGRYVAGTGNVFGVLLENSTDALIESSAVCGNVGVSGAPVRIQGDASGVTVRASFIGGWGGQTQSHGIWATDCNGDAPWIVDNAEISAEGVGATTQVNGVRTTGDCHPVIDSNLKISAGNEGGAANTTGVFCGRGTSTDTASGCTVVSNASIQGSLVGAPPNAVAVHCVGGGCARIAGNHIDGRGGVESYGIHVEAGGPVIENNHIEGGCGTTVSVGVKTDGSWARLHNNRIFGGSCNIGSVAAGGYSIGVWDTHGAMNTEVDVHSNTIDGGGYEGTCNSIGVKVSSMNPTGTLRGAGIYRNNIIRPGRCGVGHGVEEGDLGGDPRIFEHNNIEVLAANGAAVMYRDEATTDLRNIDAVNGLTDMMSVANIAVASGFVSYPADLHLTSGSMCIGAGTPTGAPATDMDGDPRDPVTPDIGADEF